MFEQRPAIHVLEEEMGFAVDDIDEQRLNDVLMRSESEPGPHLAFESLLGLIAHQKLVLKRFYCEGEFNFAIVDEIDDTHTPAAHPANLMPPRQ